MMKDVNIVRKLGEGTFADVYSCTYKNKECALKVNVRGYDASRGMPDVREIDCLNRFRHRHILSLRRIVYGDIGKEIGNVEEIKSLPGNASASIIIEKGVCNIYDIIVQTRATKNAGMRMDYSLLKTTAVNILLALDYIHKLNIIHRDLKAENIIVFRRQIEVDGVERVEWLTKLSDFGNIAYYDRNDPPRELTSPAIAVAPESAATIPYDTKADIWSFGCTLYEMVFGVPFINPNITSHNTHTENARVILQSICNNFDNATVSEFNAWGSRRLSSFKPVGVNADTVWYDRGRHRHSSQSVFESNQTHSFRQFMTLLKSLLIINPIHRMSAEQALELPFFDSCRKYINETLASNNMKATSQLTRYNTSGHRNDLGYVGQEYFKVGPGLDYSRQLLATQIIPKLSMQRDMFHNKPRILFHAYDIFIRSARLRDECAELEEIFEQEDGPVHFFLLCLLVAVKSIHAYPDFRLHSCYQRIFGDKYSDDFIDKMQMKDHIICWSVREVIYNVTPFEVLGKRIRSDRISTILTNPLLNQAMMKVLIGWIQLKLKDDTRVEDLTSLLDVDISSSSSNLRAP